MELHVIWRASQSPPWNGYPSAPLTKRVLPSLLVPQTPFRGGRGETSGAVAKYPVEMRLGNFTDTVKGSREGKRLTRVTSPIACGSGVTSRDSPIISGYDSPNWRACLHAIYRLAMATNPLRKNNSTMSCTAALPVSLLPDMFNIHPHPSPGVSPIRVCQ